MLHIPLRNYIFFQCVFCSWNLLYFIFFVKCNVSCFYLLWNMLQVVYFAREICCMQSFYSWSIMCADFFLLEAWCILIFLCETCCVFFFCVERVASWIFDSWNLLHVDYFFKTLMYVDLCFQETCYIFISSSWNMKMLVTVACCCFISRNVLFHQLLVVVSFRDTFTLNFLLEKPVSFLELIADWFFVREVYCVLIFFLQEAFCMLIFFLRET